MTAFRRLLMSFRRGLGLGRVGRWALLLALSFDLVGSPFHEHIHDFAADVHQTTDATTPESVHIDADERYVFGHSLASLLPARLQFRDLTAATPAAAPGPQARNGVSSPAVAYAFRFDVHERVPIEPRTHLRPDNRAPPLLHT